MYIVKKIIYFTFFNFFLCGKLFRQICQMTTNIYTSDMVTTVKEDYFSDYTFSGCFSSISANIFSRNIRIE